MQATCSHVAWQPVGSLDILVLLSVSVKTSQGLISAHVRFVVVIFAVIVVAVVVCRSSNCSIVIAIVVVIIEQCEREWTFMGAS